MARGLTRLAWLHWGSEGVENRQERKRIFLTNLLACLFGSVLIPYCVFYTWMGWRYLAIMSGVSSLGCFAVLVCNARGCIQLSRWLFFVVCFGAGFALLRVLGYPTGMPLAAFTLGCIPIAIFGVQVRWRIYLTSLMALLYYCMGYLIYTGSLVPAAYHKIVHLTFMATILLSVIVMFYAIAITYDAHERELEQANRAQRDFLARMSHELRTPLNAIIGYSEILEEDASADDLDPERALADIQHIQYSSRYLLTLINDLLDLSKVLSGHVELAYENIEVGSFCEQIQASLLPLAVAQGNRITLEIAPELSVFEADATKLRQCLFNLLSNAVKFTRGGTILFSVSRSETQDAGLRFTVEDSGVGMSSDEIEKIFMPYVQLKNSTSKSQGTGLGLSITHQLVLLMGGSLAVESEKGVGTTCTLQLPFRGVS